MTVIELIHVRKAMTSSFDSGRISGPGIGRRVRNSSCAKIARGAFLSGIPVLLAGRPGRPFAR